MKQTGGDARIIAGQATPGQVLAVLSLACLSAAVFTSEPLLAWVNALPDSDTATLLRNAAATWNGAMTAAGATKPYHFLHDLLRTIEAAGQ